MYYEYQFGYYNFTLYLLTFWCDYIVTKDKCDG